MKLTMVAVTAASVVLLASGCGATSNTAATPSPTSTASATQVWADGVCSSITTWKTAITAAATSVAASGISQDSLKAAADQAKTATQTLESDLKGLGRPDTASGQQAQALVGTLSTQLTNDLDTIQTAVQGASGIKGVLGAVPTVSATLVTMGTQVSSTVTTLRTLDAGGEIQSAFQGSAACQQLASPSPTP